MLDYGANQARVLRNMSQSYGLILLGERLRSMYDEFEEAKEKGDFTMLPELHALTAGFKAFSSDTAAAGIEQCRRACGGQGYLAASGLPAIYHSYIQNVTWDGDNTVMSL